MTFEQCDELSIFKGVTGSIAYGTERRDAEGNLLSDVDTRGVFVYPIEQRLGLFELPAEAEKTGEDFKLFELKKFFELAIKATPNIIELLYLPESCVTQTSPAWDMIMANRSLFMTQKALVTHTAYAISQIKKARGQNKLINNPMPEAKPDRLDWCWIVPKNSTDMHSISIKESGIDLSKCRISAVPHFEDTYLLFDRGNGVFKGDMMVYENTPVSEIDGLIGLFVFHQEAWKAAVTKWHEYWDWMKVRNEARWKIQEQGLDYDCYSPDTEFLTENGWKKFDQIQNENLGTINSHHGLCFQKPLERIDRLFSGKMVTFENRYTRFSVTSTHNLYLNDCHRSIKNGFNRAVTDQKWYLQSFEDYWNGKRSNKHFLVSLTNNASDFDVSDSYLKLVAFYISEGSIAFGKECKASAIYFSQKEGGKICQEMEAITGFEIRTTVCYREHMKSNEVTYRIQNQELAERFLKDFGHGCRCKKLPEWIMRLSKRQVEVFLNALILGDGHKHRKGHSIYYTTSSMLADQLQLLLFRNGKASQIYKYSKHKGIFQVFIPKTDKETVTITKQNRNGKPWHTEEVKNQRVVCFSVPSGKLITRNRDKIAVQGNCKNMLHLIRLLYSGVNIIKNGEPIVRFSGDTLAFLRKIREGAYTYDELMSVANEQMEFIEAEKDNCPLPVKVNSKAVNDLFRSVLDAVS